MTRLSLLLAAASLGFVFTGCDNKVDYDGVDCKETPNHPSCNTQPDCDTNPTAPGCDDTQPDCDKNPTAPGCDDTPDCDKNPSDPACATGGTGSCDDDSYVPPTNGGGFCKDVADYDDIREELPGMAQGCAIQCGAMDDEVSDAELTSCTSCCLADKAVLPVDCASCVADVVACAAKHCANKCSEMLGGSPTSQECLDCRATNRCDERVAACVGR